MYEFIWQYQSLSAPPPPTVEVPGFSWFVGDSSLSFAGVEPIAGDFAWLELHTPVAAPTWDYAAPFLPVLPYELAGSFDAPVLEVLVAPSLAWFVDFNQPSPIPPEVLGDFAFVE